MDIGTIGIWKSKRYGADAVPEIEALGFGALWLGGSPSVEQAREYVERGTSLPVITGILNVWQHKPEDVAAAHAKITQDFPDRFWLGIGIGHPEATSDYTRPLKTMREFFDGLDAAATPVPKDERLAAALGPKMLDLSAERSLGTHPYFISVEHTRFARERVGDGVLVAPEVAVVVEQDDETARKIAREYAKTYLGLTNYTSNLLRFGFSEDDVANGGSDRLIDAVIPHGSAERIAEAVRAHLDAGADHVCLQPLGNEPLPPRRLPRAGSGVGLTRLVAVVEHQGVPVGVGEERHVAHARVHDVAEEPHALGLELGAGGGDVVDVQRDRVADRVVLQPHALRVEHVQG